MRSVTSQTDPGRSLVIHFVNVPYFFYTTDTEPWQPDLRRTSGEIYSNSSTQLLPRAGISTCGSNTKMDPPKPLKASVVGAGICGRHSAAKKRTFDPGIFEASEIKTEVGADIGVQVNALRVLERWGGLSREPERLRRSTRRVERASLTAGWYPEWRKSGVYYVTGATSMMNLCGLQPAKVKGRQLNFTSKAGFSNATLSEEHVFEVSKLQGIPDIDWLSEGLSGARTLRVLPLLPTWIRGRAALLGDAAHATLPALGQGAAMAIEEASALGCLIPLGTRREDVPSRLEAYQTLRKPRRDYVNRESPAQGAEPSNWECLFSFARQLKKCNLICSSTTPSKRHKNTMRNILVANDISSPRWSSCPGLKGFLHKRMMLWLDVRQFDSRDVKWEICADAMHKHRYSVPGIDLDNFPSRRNAERFGGGHIVLEVFGEADSDKVNALKGSTSHEAIERVARRRFDVVHTCVNAQTGYDRGKGARWRSQEFQKAGGRRNKQIDG
ncbi:hypothetical protein C8R43DRAFT_1197222 [Mycena crocata]|nr:hypothetical protein C8R43DRAFT_1197222 [Mycena crocata]